MVDEERQERIERVLDLSHTLCEVIAQTIAATVLIGYLSAEDADATLDHILHHLQENARARSAPWN